MRADGTTETLMGILEALGFGRKPEVPLTGKTVLGGPGDTLRKLALQHYGDEEKWTIIHEANRGHLSRRDPELGEKCFIPDLVQGAPSEES